MLCLLPGIQMAITCKNSGLSIIVIGASGDLAGKKVYPALFSLFIHGCLPDKFIVYGFARSGFTHDAFRDRIRQNLAGVARGIQSPERKIAEFLANCFYFAGEYESKDSFLDLFAEVRELECDKGANRLFYMAIPPSVFLPVARAIGDAGLVNCRISEPWSRVVLEKPFGEDRESSDKLMEELAKVFTEVETFRMDHYLGKEVIQNLLVLRFANLIFEPIWNSRYIRNVLISWKEDIGVEDRGGYFDAYGIIRDVMQNHLLQVLALTAIEPPGILNAASICREKVKLLRSIAPVRRGDAVIGQYAGKNRSYRNEKHVAPDSITPTYAAVGLQINNDRWSGVPFMICAGKGLDARMTEIRIRFRDVPGNMFCQLGSCPLPNELVIRIQPDEAIKLTITNKLPGFEMALAPTNLDLSYKTAFGREIPDAYESLILEVLEGDRSLFIQNDELAAAWDIFTPLLHSYAVQHECPELYEFGGGGPASAAALAARLGVGLV